MKHIKTSSGFEADLDEECINDMELLDAVAALQKTGDMLAASAVVEKVCGQEKQRLYDHCRNEKGRVPIEKITGEVTEIFDALNAKNS